MTREEKIEAIRQRARKNFSLGYNCTECVTEAVLTLVDTGLPPEVKKVATGFGGGVGLFGDTCGAITGAVIAVANKLEHLPEVEHAMTLESFVPADQDKKRAIITDAAGIAAELIMTDRDEASSKPFGVNVEKLEAIGLTCDLSEKGT